VLIFESYVKLAARDLRKELDDETTAILTEWRSTNYASSIATVVERIVRMNLMVVREAIRRNS
jgi:hypothetical protein